MTFYVEMNESAPTYGFEIYLVFSKVYCGEIATKFPFSSSYKTTLRHHEVRSSRRGHFHCQFRVAEYILLFFCKGFS